MNNDSKIYNKKDFSKKHNIIPDYDFIFNEVETKKSNKSVNFFAKLIKVNSKSIVWAIIAFILINTENTTRSAHINPKIRRILRGILSNSIPTVIQVGGELIFYLKRTKLHRLFKNLFSATTGC